MAHKEIHESFKLLARASTYYAKTLLKMLMVYCVQNKNLLVLCTKQNHTLVV